MRRWFLSYNSKDFALAQRLKAALVRREPDAHVFFAPEKLRAGGFWMQQLAEELAQSTAFVLLVGESEIGAWQVIEYNHAFDRRAREGDYPVILIKSNNRPVPGLPFVNQVHWLDTEEPTSEATISRLVRATGEPAAQPDKLWRHTRPYRGLEAMTEANSDFFFGRAAETVEVIKTLASKQRKLPVLLGDSGVGKSSVARAGVLAAMMRQGWQQTSSVVEPWPDVFHNSKGWCFLTLKPDAEPVRAIVQQFVSTWHFEATDPARAKRVASWTQDLLDGRLQLRDLLDATQAHYRNELHQAEPPAFLLYIDQGEELYVRAPERDRGRFSEILAKGLADKRLRAMMSMRVDFLGKLLKDEALYPVHQQINIPPLRDTQLREVVGKPAEVLSARFATPDLVEVLTQRAVREKVGALPLLSYTLDDMWSAMVGRGDGVLRLDAKHIALGSALVDRAEKFLSEHDNAEAALRRVFILCATISEDGEPMGRRAPRSVFSDDEWQLVCELASFPNRLLVVTAMTQGGEIYAEVAHESIFEHWQKLRDWVVAEREFLSWRQDFGKMRKRWEAEPEASKDDHLLRKGHLNDAQKWLKGRGSELENRDREFIALSEKRYKQDQEWIDRKRLWDKEEQALRKEVAQTIRGVIGSLKRIFE